MNVNDSVEQKVPHNYSVYVLRSMLVLLILVCLFVFFSSLSFFQFLVLRAGHRETRPLPTVHAGLWHSVSDWHFYSVLLNLNNFSHTHTHTEALFSDAHCTVQTCATPCPLNVAVFFSESVGESNNSPQQIVSKQCGSWMKWTVWFRTHPRWTGSTEMFMVEFMVPHVQ